MLWDFILRLFIAGILGAVIGLDREYRAKEAGYRTHFLVSLGSALIIYKKVVFRSTPAVLRHRLLVVSALSEREPLSYKNNLFAD